jgi:cyclic pyranopterin monophosphate synthase
VSNDPRESRSTHFDSAGDARMVDVSAKAVTVRVATAVGLVSMQRETAEMIRRGTAAKGDVLAIARLAAITATKLTPLLIPLCHGIAVEAVEVRFAFEDESTLRCEVDVRSSGKTGVEMEAMTAVSVACLTVYDMCKSVDRAMSIVHCRLLHKSGGASGTYQAADRAGSPGRGDSD